MKTPVYILFGAPGSGKGTQSKLLVEKLNFQHISTGDILRSRLRNAEESGKLDVVAKYIKMCFEKGELVNDATAILVAKDAFDMNAPAIVLDGFPRTLAQAHELEKILIEKEAYLAGAFHIDITPEICTERLLNRQDNRQDDTLPIILERLSIYNERTANLIDYYKSIKKYFHIEGTGTPEKINLTITSIINETK